MKKINTKKIFWLSLIILTQILICSCGEEIDNIDPSNDLDKINTVDINKQLIKGKGQTDSLDDEFSQKHLNKNFFEFLDRNPNLDIGVSVYYKDKEKEDLFWSKYNVFEKNESTLYLKKYITNTDLQRDVNIEFNDITTWQNLLVAMYKHPDFYSVSTGNYQIEDKTYKTVQFRNVPPSFLFNYINKFYLTAYTIKVENLVPNLKVVNTSYPIKMYLMIADIMQQRKDLNEKYVLKKVNELNQYPDIQNQVIQTAIKDVEQRLNQFHDITRKLDSKLGKIPKSKNGRRPLYDATPIHAPAEFKNLPASLQNSPIPLANSTNANLEIEDRSTISDTWNSLALTSWIEPYGFLDQVNKEVSGYIEYLNSNKLETLEDCMNPAILTNNSELTMFNTYLEVTKDSGVPVKIEIEYKYPVKNDQLEPIFTANKFTLFVKNDQFLNTSVEQESREGVNTSELAAANK